MKPFSKQLTMVLAVTAAVSLMLPAEAYAGKGGGMSRSMGGSMSRSMGSSMSRSMGSSMSRSMSGGFSGGMSRSMGSSMSRSMGSSMSKSMGGSANLGSRTSINSSLGRSLGQSMSRSRVTSPLNNSKNPVGGLSNSVRNLPVGGSLKPKSPLGNASNLVRGAGKSLDRGMVKDLGVSKGRLGDMIGRGGDKGLSKSRLDSLVGRDGKSFGKDLTKVKLGDLTKNGIDRGRLSNVIKGKLGSNGSSLGRDSRITDSLKDRIRTGGVNKLDRSKLRDLVKAVEGKGKGPLGGKSGDVFGGLGKNKLIDGIKLAGLAGLHSNKLAAGKFGDKSFGLKAGAKSILPGGCFPHHDDHCHDFWHNGWFGFGFGHHGWDHCYDYPCHDHYYYDYCWEPYYVYPACGVTFVTYPEAPAASSEIVSVAATKPIVLEEAIDLSSPSDALEISGAVVSETADAAASDEAASDVATALAEALAAARLASEAATEPTSADEPANETNADEPEGESLPVKFAEQPEMDLELINVEMADAGNRDAELGPRFKVTIRNAGKRDLEKFLVSLVACKDAQIDSTSLHASATVDALAAGGEATIEVTLPADSLTLTRDADGSEAPFSTLIAAVDSDERINEGNEDNNLSLIDRTSIRLAGN